MLTYETKRSLLESWLHQNLNKDCDGNECYAWVCDLDDSNVYFNYMGDYFRAGYLILESDEQSEGSVNINLDAKEKVVRSWATFAEECSNADDNACEEKTCEEKTCEEVEEETHSEEAPVEEEMSSEEQSCDEEPKDNMEEQPEDDGDENDEDDKNDDSDDSNDSDYSDDSDNHDTFSEGEESVDLNTEPNVTEVENKSMEEIIETSTKSIAAPEVQTEAENMGDANAQVTEVLDYEVTEEIAEDSINTISETVSVGPDGQEAVVVGEVAEDETDVEQPDDNDKEAIFEAVTVEVNGENLDINALLEKYNALKDEFEALNQTVKSQKVQALIQFATDFINADSDVDEDSRNSYIEQISEKCLSCEFTSEAEIEKFAKSLLAMYYYENKVSKKETSDFSFSIEHHVHTEKPVSGNNKLRDAINKLNRI